MLVSSEAVPYAKTGGLADVAGSLPVALAELGAEVTLVLPFYREVGMVEESAVPVRGQDAVVTYHEPPASLEAGVKTVLVRNDHYFWRDRLYGYTDEAERFVFFDRAVAELVRTNDWQPDVVHCNDWQTGLVPVYLRLLAEAEPRFARTRTLFTVHNLAFQGIFPEEAMEVAGLPWDLFRVDGLEFYGQVNFLKAGLLFSDMVTTVSPTYAKEIQTPDFGERLDGVLRERADRLAGILNGIDTRVWNPGEDKYLPAVSARTPGSRKPAYKKALQQKVGLPAAAAPVLGVVARLARQKGFDLLCEALPGLLEEKFQLVVLGVGEEDIQGRLEALAKEHPDRIKALFRFDEHLAHLIYAGSDLFLMPSRYEPCGLGQMIALRYGSIPVVHATGGLADTVQGFDAATGEGNGFVFREPTAEALAAAIREGLSAYKKERVWADLVGKVVGIDHSWRKSAGQYLELYRRLMEEEPAKS
jgi:starch synthase